MTVPAGAISVTYTITAQMTGQPDMDLSFTRPLAAAPQRAEVQDAFYFAMASAGIQALRDRFPNLTIIGGRTYTGTLTGDPWQP